MECSIIGRSVSSQLRWAGNLATMEAGILARKHEVNNAKEKGKCTAEMGECWRRDRR